jgi:hydrogenase maturation protein HypF
MKALRIYVTGMVQGVGFRPFVRRIAKVTGVRGYVRNLGGGEVEIVVESEEEDRVGEFLRLLRERRPPPAKLEIARVEEVKPADLQDFTILDSGSERIMASEIPQDLAVCEHCLGEVVNPASRWYRYPFNSCAWCGPRYSMIYKPPYDRENTAMRDFPLCDECLSEYNDLWNERRYHAQGISCPRCGPRVFLLDRNLERVEVDGPLGEAARLIDEGMIVAVKGIGGYHIACLASDDEVVSELRRRKGRPRKPFAIMALNLEVAEKLVEIPEDLIDLFTGFIKPIMILPRREGCPVSDYVAPSLRSLGIMLAYTPLHYLLLMETKDRFLIMTSGNVHGDPMISDDSRLKELTSIVDYVLTHNRRIAHRVDDSVVRPTHGGPVILRYGRGYAPRILRLRHALERPVVAFGGDLETNGAVGFDDKIILAPYSGDMDNLRVLEEHVGNLEFLAGCYGLEERRPVVAADLHPAYHSRRAAEKYASSNGLELKLVQHHIAHFASVMAEVGHEREEPAVGIMIDGAGYGLDGAIWGGEIIAWADGRFERGGFLDYSLMPGGDLAAYRPVRMLASILSKFMDLDEVESFILRRGLLKGLKHGSRELGAALAQIRRGGGPMTSSAGRFLDSVSALLNLCLERTYEGEPAIMLEEASYGGELVIRDSSDNFVSERGDALVIMTGEIMRAIVESLDSNSRHNLAYTAQYTLGRHLGIAAAEKARELGVKAIYVSGGAAVNRIILSAIGEASGLEVRVNRIVPPGDGGAAVGQVYFAGCLGAD